MFIEFKCKTNKDYVAINTVKFKLKSGSTITIDRHETDYSIENGNLEMSWNDCYLWSIDDNYIFVSSPWPYIGLDSKAMRELLEGAEAEFELEDDADEDYTVEIESWEVY